MVDSFIEQSSEARLGADTVDEIATEYGHEYWRECAERGQFPEELWDVLGDRGFLGILVPEAYDGEGMGMRELVALVEGFTSNGVRLLYFIIHVTMAPVPIATHGSETIKERFLPEIASCDSKFCFAIPSQRPAPTPSRSGRAPSATLLRRSRLTPEKRRALLGTATSTSSTARRPSSPALRRPTTSSSSRERTPYEEIADDDRRYGGTLLVVPTDADGITMEPLDLAITETVDQYSVHFNDVRVPIENRIGEKDRGFFHVFDALNPERIAGAAEAVGLGRFVLNKAVEYAKDREVFDAPIGSHQRIQHDLSEAKIDLELAALANQRAIEAYETDSPDAGSYANVANYVSTEAADRAFDVAVQTHGGNGLSRDYDLITLQNNVRLGRIAPVSNQMILNHIGESVLGLPKSY